MKCFVLLFVLTLASSTMAFSDPNVRRDNVPTTTSRPGPGLGPGRNQPSTTSKRPSLQLLSSVLDVSAASIPTDRTNFSPRSTTTATSQSAASSPASSSSSIPASTSTPAVPQLDICWSSGVCSALLDNVNICLGTTGPVFVDPNNIGEESKRFQQCLCTQEYKNIVDMYNRHNASTILDCYACIQQAGIDIDASNLPPAQFRQKLDDFCNSDQPNAFDLLVVLLYFTQYGRMPEQKALLPPGVSPLTTVFTPTSGMNKPTTTAPPGPDTTPPPALQWWESTLTPGALIPTEYLAQLPPNWPYTAYAMRRSAGQTTSWPFVHPNTTTQTVAWLYHSLLWYPRPLYTPPAAKAANANANGTAWNTALDGWTHAFIYETLTATALPTTTATTTPPPLVSRNPFVPTLTQSSVLPLDPDSDAEIRASMSSRQEAEKSSRSSSGLVGAMGVTRSAAVTEGAASVMAGDGMGMEGSAEEGARWRSLWDEVRGLESRIRGWDGRMTEAETMSETVQGEGEIER